MTLTRSAGILAFYGIFAKKSNKISNPIFPIFSDFIRFFPIFRLLATFSLPDSTALIRTGLFERVWFGLVPILFGNDLSGSHLSYSKGFMKFGWPEPPKKWLTFIIFHWSERPPTQFVKFWYLWWTSFFRKKEIVLWGKKRTALFQTHN